MYNKPPRGTPYNFVHPLSRGLIGYWLFNEMGGTTVNDISINKHTGTLNNFSLTGNTSNWTGSPLGGCITFDGTNDYISMGNVLDQTGSTPFSISAWIKTTATGSSDNIIVSKNTYSPLYTGWGFGLNVCTNTSPDAGKVGVVFVDNIETPPASTVGSVMRRQSTATYNDGKWHHVVMTYDGTKTRAGMLLYIDGVEPTYQNYDATSIPGSMTNSTNFQIGGRDVTHSFFNGNIDEVRMYNRVLNVSEIRMLYTNPHADFNYTSPHKQFIINTLYDPFGQMGVFGI